MRSLDLFEFYRFLLTILVTCYTGTRLALFIWRWQGQVDEVLGTALLRRYVIVLLLRFQLRRFLYEFCVLGFLVGSLYLLIRLHWK